MPRGKKKVEQVVNIGEDNIMDEKTHEQKEEVLKKTKAEQKKEATKKTGKIKLVYFGKKSPKEIVIEIEGKVYKESFVPFKEVPVEEQLAMHLLFNAGDIFKVVREANQKAASGDEDVEHDPRTKGHVGDAHAQHIPDLDKEIEKQNKSEQGKTLDDLKQDVKREKIKNKVREAKNG